MEGSSQYALMLATYILLLDEFWDDLEGGEVEITI